MVLTVTDMGNLAGSRKSQSIKKDLEVIEHSSLRAFHYLQPGRDHTESLQRCDRLAAHGCERVNPGLWSKRHSGATGTR
ncbi:hypothetical protein EMIT0P253_320010 [Pseudomonas sp. IT-P253]